MKIPPAFAALCLIAVIPGFAQTTKPTVPDAEEPIQLSPFEVKAGVAEGYLATEMTTGTRYAAPIAEIPFSVNVITKEFMEDFLAFDLAGQEVMSYTSSFSNENVNGSTGAFVVRGIRGFALYKNGIREGGLFGPASIDRMENIKGSNSSIYGAAEPGGLINRVTKEGQPHPFQELTVNVGQKDFSRVMVDVNQPIIPGKLLARFASSYDNSRQYMQDRAHFWRQNFYGSTTWRIQPGLDFTIHSEYIKIQGTAQGQSAMPFVIPATLIAGSTAAQQANQFIGQLGKGEFSRFKHLNYLLPESTNGVRYAQTDANLAKTFGKALTVRLLGSYWLRDQTNPTTANSGTNAAAYSLITNTLQGSETLKPQSNKQNQYNAAIDALYRFDTGPVNHSTLLTLDYLKFRQPRRVDVTSSRADAIVPLQNFLIGLPFENPTFPSAVDYGNTAVWDKPGTNQKTGSTTKGISLTESAAFFHRRLIVNVSGRRDLLHNSLINYAAATTLQGHATPIPAGQLVEFPSQSANTYRAGVTFKISKQLAAFGSVSTAFLAQANDPPLDINGLPLPPQKGTSKDFGFKGAFLDDRLTFTTSYFDILRENQARNALEPTGVRSVSPITGLQYSTVGDVRSYGYELDSAWQATKAWNMHLALGWNHVRFARIPNVTEQYLLGVTPDSTPTWTGGTYTTYHFGNGWLRGLNARLGVRWRSSSLVNTTTNSVYGNSGIKGPPVTIGGVVYNTYYFKNAGYALVDAGLGYTWKTGKYNQRVSLDIKNALDKNYFIGPNIQMGFAANLSYSLKH
jgi:iron complex outermembrane recepter protein